MKTLFHQCISMQRNLMFLAAIVLLFVLSACSSGAQPVDLEGSKWVLTSLEGKGLLPGTRITLEFQEGKAGGFTGCNSYGGSYSTGRGNSLELKEVAITLQACLEPEGVMDQEQVYTSNLFKAAFFQLEEDQLELLDSDKNVLLVYTRQQAHNGDPAALPGTTWKLISLRGADPVTGSLIWLAFDDTTYSGFAGCRHFSGTYEAGTDNLGFPFLEMKEIHCFAPQAIREQEDTFTNMLSTSDTFSLAENHLEIFALDGSSMVFEPAGQQSLESEPFTWNLVTFKTANDETAILPGTTITLVIDENSVSGSAGCNSYGANFTFDGSFFTFQPVISTMMACESPAGVMEQETRYLRTLQDISLYRIEGNNLILETQDGRGLVLTTE